MPPNRSGIADYSAHLLPALRRRVEVEVARPGRHPRADVRLYHVGNDPDAHGWIVDALAERPGVVVLHEHVLHHLIAGITIGRGRGKAYLAAMERELGVVGRLLGLGVLDNLLPLLWETRPQDYPLVGTILDLATGLVVHSRTVEEAARRHGYGGPIWRIPHPAWPHPAVEPADVHGEPLVGCFGNLNMNKRIPELLEAFARLRAARPGARLLLVGASAERFDLDRRLERLGLAGDPAIVREEYVPEERLWSLIAACDVCVNLRFPTMGETSGSVLRVLSLGRPAVVSDVGWFSELPDEVALKVPVDEFEARTLAAALDLLSLPAAREAMSRAALAYVRREHDLDRCADRYAAALEQAAGGEAVADAVLGEVARAAADVGLPDAELTLVAGRIRESGL
ncbi:MAG TPA: glycosyltransferase [Gaiellaceae bacterium]|nr:glycosyltransferase [Gaiellaceae bacterium]